LPAGCATWTISNRLTEKLTQKTKLASGLIENVVYQDNHLFYDAQNRLRASFDGRTDVRISYDLAGNRSQVKTSVINNLYKVNFAGQWWQSPGWYDQVDNASVTTYAYDAMNRQTVSREEQTQKLGANANAVPIVTILTHNYGYDAAGNLLGSLQTTDGRTNDAVRTTYQYQFNGSYQQTESTTTQGGSTATTKTLRDANGFISSIEQQGSVYDTRYNRAFVNDARGNALYVNQSAGTTADKGGRIQNEPGGYIGGFIGDAINPGHIQRQLVANGEVLARYGDAPDSENPPRPGDVPKYVNTAEFHLNAPALKLRDTNFSAMSYTVVGGKTLKTIARNVLGDSGLGWRKGSSTHKPRHPRPKLRTAVKRGHQVLVVEPLFHHDAPQAFLDGGLRGA
jgi:YD repeat-containing protein